MGLTTSHITVLKSEGVESFVKELCMEFVEELGLSCACGLKSCFDSGDLAHVANRGHHPEVIRVACTLEDYNDLTKWCAPELVNDGRTCLRQQRLEDHMEEAERLARKARERVSEVRQRMCKKRRTT